MKERNEEVLAMFAIDMVAYRPETRNFQVGLSPTSVDPLLNDLFTEVAKDYTPDLQVCISTSCCTDQRSFYAEGFSAVRPSPRPTTHLGVFLLVLIPTPGLATAAGVAAHIRIFAAHSA